jgi:hypothetical protein
MTMKIREKSPGDVFKGFKGSLSSFLAGVARLFDFWGLLDSYETTSSAGMTDAKALYADWRAIGSDIDFAIRSYRRTEAQRK